MSECRRFLNNCSPSLRAEIWKVGKVGKVGRLGKVGKVGKEGMEGRLRECGSQLPTRFYSSLTKMVKK